MSAVPQHGRAVTTVPAAEKSTQTSKVKVRAEYTQLGDPRFLPWHPSDLCLHGSFKKQQVSLNT